MIKILVTTVTAMVSGHVSNSSIVVEAKDRAEADEIVRELRAADQEGGRVRYSWVVPN